MMQINRLLCSLFTLVFIHGATVSAVDYDNPIRELGSSAGTIAKGSALFHRSPLSILDHELGSSQRLGIEIFQVDSMNSYSTMALGVTVPQGNLSWMLGYARSGDDEIPYTTQSGLDNEHIRTGQQYGLTKAMMKIGLSHEEDGIRKGVGVTMYQTEIAGDTGQGFGLSLSYGVDVQRHLTLLASIENAVATKMSYKDGEEELNRRLSIGIESRVLTPFHINLGVSKQFSELDKDYLMNAGISYELNDWIWLSGAYYERYAGLDKKEYLSMGLGLSLFQLSVSYAYRVVEYREADIQHYISVRLESTKPREVVARKGHSVREDYRRRTNQKMRVKPDRGYSESHKQERISRQYGVEDEEKIKEAQIKKEPENIVPKVEEQAPVKKEIFTETEVATIPAKKDENPFIQLQELNQTSEGGLIMVDGLFNTNKIVIGKEIKGVVKEEKKRLSLYERIKRKMRTLNDDGEKIVSIGKEG